MKKVSKIMIASLALAGTLGIAGVALAGNKSLTGVGIYGRSMWGNMSDARAAADTNSLIQISFYDSGGAVHGYVRMTNSVGTSGYCYTSEPAKLQVLQSAKTDSYVYAAWDAAGACTQIAVDNSSAISPKQP